MSARAIASFVLGLGLLAPWSGCTFAAHSSTPGVAAGAAVLADSVQLFAEEPAGRPYLVLGTVSSDSMSADAAAARLRAEAGRMGAHAVVRLRLTKMTGYTSRVGLTGTAVRWQSLSPTSAPAAPSVPGTPTAPGTPSAP